MSSKYEFDFDPETTNTSHGLVVGLVPARSRVLDVGCAVGYLGDALAEKQCTVHGIELDPAAAEVARTRLASVVVADAETLDYQAAFGEEAFDVVVLADVLEHCRNPERVLAGALSVLAEAGTLVISIPNVGHGSLRLALLQGRWNYTPLGLLDETHVRFFTWDTLNDLLTGVGLTISEAWMTTADPLATEVDVDPADLPAEVADWVRAQPLAQGYQFVLVARRTLPDEDAPRALPTAAGSTVVPPVSPTILSAREEAQSLRATIEARDDELRMAKEIIAYHETVEGDLRRQVGDQQDELRVAKEINAHQDAVLLNLHTSATWRAGRAVTAPARAIRRTLGR